MNLPVSHLFAALLPIETTTLAGVCLWSLALYLSFASLRERVTTQLEQGLQRVVPVRFLGGEKRDNGVKPSGDRVIAPDSPIFLYASLLSILPFIAIGFCCNYGVEISLGRSWAVSTGILACMGCGVYELGRRSQ